MLATLIHSTLVSDSQSERDENKKLYNNLIKKLRKELADKNSSTIKLVRQLLPHAKAACTNSCEVIACEPVGSLLDTKVSFAIFVNQLKNSIRTIFKGLRITEKERVSMWDLLEGHKNPAPLLWSWFGAVKMERKPLTYEEDHRLLKYHTHSLVKPSSYFYEPLQLPPEDAEEPTQDKNREEKADTPSSAESPAGAPGTKSRKGTKRPRKSKTNATPTPANVNQVPGNQMPNQIQNQGMNPMMNQQMMNQQMGQQFNPNQPQQQMGGNMGMMNNNMMMNQMGMEIGQNNMSQNQMQMNQMGMNNQMQQSSNTNMGQMNPMQYQQQQQQQQMNMNQQNMGQQNMNMMGQQNQQWGYQQQQQQQPVQGGQTNQQFYNQGAVGGMPAVAPQSKLIRFL